MLLSVIIPVFNEEESIVNLIEKVQRVPVAKEIIVVDDCSQDRTPELLRTIPDIRVLTHSRNQGKGAAIRTGLKYARGDVVIIQDADLEYDPADYPQLLVPFADKNVGAVFGSRFRGRGRFLLYSQLANILLTFFTNALFGGKITDMETCYKVIRRPLLQKLALVANQFDIEPEITAKLLRFRVRIAEVPIHYTARTKGKKIGWQDGVAAIKTLLRWYVC
ncbi:glycosyltransferase family 2 protein [candidate division WOR-3 bacterium]|nr:glycosyltransferase family 2 protein [candidate division WOR-3 bacterium]